MTGILRRFRRGLSYYDEEVEAYRRLSQNGFRPDAIIDVGAYEGNWTIAARKVFGDLPGLMVEPQKAKRDHLERMCAAERDLQLAACLLGGRSGEMVTFYEMETGSSFLPERSDAPRRAVTLQLRTLDDVAGDLPGENLFLKIDSQGAELEILKGGAETLGRAGVVQLETAILPYNEGAPKLVDTLRFMDDRGFHPVDISGHTRIQDHLVQIDMLFVPAGSPLRRLFFHFGAA